MGKREGEAATEKWDAAHHGTSTGSKPSGSKGESNKGGAQLSQQLTGTGNNVWPRSVKTETHTQRQTDTHLHGVYQQNRVKTHRGLTQL